nr:hypothetical protein [Prevotella sp.]
MLNISGISSNDGSTTIDNRRTLKSAASQRRNTESGGNQAKGINYHLKNNN